MAVLDWNAGLGAQPAAAPSAVVQHAAAMADPALGDWLRTTLATGEAPASVVQRLITSGRPPEVAETLVGLAVQGIFMTAPARDGRVGMRPNVDTAHTAKHLFEHEGVQVRTLVSEGRGNLEVAVYDGLITPVEIERIKRLAGPLLERSRVMGRDFTNIESEVRTSAGAFLRVGCDPIIAGLEARISALVGIPVSHGEGLQVLHYTETNQYRPHFDYFEPTTPKERAMLALPGNRVGTMILYLNDVEEGGATYFPQLDLAVHPGYGQALWFAYLPNGCPDTRSEHAGMPVIAGEKWIATKWFRERPFVA